MNPIDLEIAEVDAEAVAEEPAEVLIQAAENAPIEMNLSAHVQLQRDPAIEAMADSYAQRQMQQSIPALRRKLNRVPKKVDRFGYQRFHCIKCHKYFVRTSMGHTSGLSYCSVQCFHNE